MVSEQGRRDNGGRAGKEGATVGVNLAPGPVILSASEPQPGGTQGEDPARAEQHACVAQLLPRRERTRGGGAPPDPSLPLRMTCRSHKGLAYGGSHGERAGRRGPR